MLPHRLSEPGPIIDYIRMLERSGKVREAKEAVRSVREALSTPGGHILMELLEKSTVQTPTKILDDNRALAARNAQSFIAHDLRRVMSDEFDALLRLEIEPYTER